MKSWLPLLSLILALLGHACVAKGRMSQSLRVDHALDAEDEKFVERACLHYGGDTSPPGADCTVPKNWPPAHISHQLTRQDVPPLPEATEQSKTSKLRSALDIHLAHLGVGQVQDSPVVRLNSEPLVLSREDSLRVLTLVDTGGRYYVRVQVTAGSQTTRPLYAVASIPACQLLEGVQDVIELRADGDGRVVGLAYHVLADPVSNGEMCPGAAKQDSALRRRMQAIRADPNEVIRFEQTTALVIFPSAGPRPAMDIGVPPAPVKGSVGQSANEGGAPTQCQQCQNEEECAQCAAAEQEREQQPQGILGLLLKYWYYVLPLVLVMFMSGGPEQEGGGGPPASG